MTSHLPESSPTRSFNVAHISALRTARTQRLHRAALAGLALVCASSMCTVALARPKTTQVVVTTRSLNTATVLQASDVALRAVVNSALPTSPLYSLQSAIGKRLSGAAAAGEIVTAVRVATRTPAGGSMLAIGFSVDVATASLLRSGDLVDVFATTEEKAAATLVGRGFEVTSVAAGAESNSAERVVYLRVPSASAPQLLAAKAHRAVSIAVRQD